MIYLIACYMCKQEFRVEVKDEEIKRWQQGMLIQDAMPNLSSADRELLISGTCDTCFNFACKSVRRGG